MESICKSYSQSKVGQTKDEGHKKGEKIIISKVHKNGSQNKELIESFSTVFISSKKELVRGSYDILKFDIRDEY